MNSIPAPKRNHWLFSVDPHNYHWDTLFVKGKEMWRGAGIARRRAAQLKQVRQGDRVLCYHAAPERSLYALAEVTRDPYPDPTIRTARAWWPICAPWSAAAAGIAGRDARESRVAQGEVPEERPADHFSGERGGVSGDPAHGRHRAPVPLPGLPASRRLLRALDDPCHAGAARSRNVVRGLRTVLPGRTIVAVRLGKTDFIDDPPALAEYLPGRRIVNVERIGKFISLELSAGPQAKNPERQFDLIVHLGMTGRLGVRRPDEPVAPHTHAFFELDDGRELRYTDIRRFGRIRLVPRRSERRLSRAAGRGAAGDFRRGVSHAAAGPPRAHQSAAARSARLPRHRQYLRRRKFMAGAHSSRAARGAA